MDAEISWITSSRSTCKEIRGLSDWDLRACQHCKAEDRRDLGNNVDGETHNRWEDSGNNGAHTIARREDSGNNGEAHCNKESWLVGYEIL